VSDELTAIENASIRSFVHFAAVNGYLSGRVLDYGCGKQPYRQLVEAAGGTYQGYDRVEFPANVSAENVGDDDVDWDDWDAVLCTQVVQYVPDVVQLLGWLHHITGAEDRRERPGYLVMTYPTNWPEVQEVDLHRFTKAGMERLLAEEGFTIIEHVRRQTFHQHGYEWAFGYGVIARA